MLRLLLLAVISSILIGCGKPSPAPKAPKPSPTPEASPQAESIPEATPTPTPKPTPIVSQSRVIFLCYHRFDNPPRDSLAISTQGFRDQMQALKDAGITVISMTDFLAWRRGEKEIPATSALVSIDDGYVSGYKEAWPVLKEFGYPFTMFVYPNYISSGGKSMTWDQLREMRDAGVDIGSHTMSHADLTKKGKRTAEEQVTWLEKEMQGSKDILEKELGIPIRTLAYPYGKHNDAVHQAGSKAGYEALFTVYGQKIPQNAPVTSIGRYAIESTKPAVFQAAIQFSQGGVPSSPGSLHPPATNLNTTPKDGETITNPLPELQVDLSSLGKIDPKSLEVSLTGFGLIPFKYDPATEILTAPLRQKLRDKAYTVTILGKSAGKKIDVRWSFFYDRIW